MKIEDRELRIEDGEERFGIAGTLAVPIAQAAVGSVRLLQAITGC
jgi:hypothetical protein